MKNENKETPYKTIIYPSEILPRNTPSPIRNFDDTFIEFVRELRRKAQFSTPEGKSGGKSKTIGASNSSININEELPNSSNTSSVIVSGVIFTSSLVSNKNKKNASFVDENKQLSIGNKRISTIISSAQSTSNFGNIKVKGRTELSSFMKDLEDSVPVFVLTKPVRTTNMSNLSTSTPKKVQGQDNTQPISFTSSAGTSAISAVAEQQQEALTKPTSAISVVTEQQQEALTKPTSAISAVTDQQQEALTKPPSAISAVTEKQQDLTKPVSSSQAGNLQTSSSSNTAKTEDTSKISEVPVQEKPKKKGFLNWRPPPPVGSLLAKALAAVPIQSKTAPISDTTNLAKPPISTPSTSKSLAKIAPQYGKPEVIPKVCSDVTILKILSLVKDEDDDVATDLEYLEEEFTLPARGRPRGKRNMPSKTTSFTHCKKICANPEPKVKRPPGRPRKPFTFDRLVAGLKSVKLPNFFWSAHVIDISLIEKQITFNRAVLDNSFKPYKYDRVIKFTNSLKYAIRINETNVELIAAPLTINTVKDIQILLKIVDDIQANDPMIKYF